MHKQVSGWTVNFCPNSQESPFLEFQTRKPPPQWKTSDLGWPKFTLKYPPAPWKTSDLRWPKFTPKYPPMENFRFGMTKVYSKIPPHGKLQIVDGHSLLRNTPPNGKLQIWDEQSLLWNTPHPPNGKLQIWDDQSLLQNTPPPHKWKTSDLRWPKFTLKSPPMENSTFGMTKVYSEIPPPKHPPPRLGIWEIVCGD